MKPTALKVPNSYFSEPMHNASDRVQHTIQVFQVRFKKINGVHLEITKLKNQIVMTAMAMP